MVTIEDLLLFNAGWILTWGIFNAVGIAFLFSNPKDNISKALQLHGIFVTLFIFLTFATSYLNIALDPNIRYSLALIRALLSLPILGTGALLTCRIWQARK